VSGDSAALLKHLPIREHRRNMKSGEVSFRQQEFLKDVVTDPEFMTGLLGGNDKNNQSHTNPANIMDRLDLRGKFSKSKNSYLIDGGGRMKNSVLSAGGGTKHRRNESGINFFDVESRNSYEVHVEMEPTFKNDLL
jgi:hypothetical protein